jgi:hypothetical protein
LQDSRTGVSLVFERVFDNGRSTSADLPGN